MIQKMACNLFCVKPLSGPNGTPMNKLQWNFNDNNNNINNNDNNNNDDDDNDDDDDNNNNNNNKCKKKLIYMCVLNSDHFVLTWKLISP